MNKKLIGLSGLLVAGTFLVGANVLAGAFLTGSRIDLTEGKLYTLSQGSRNIVASLEDPITLRFYFSDKATANIPFVRSYANRVRELLQEYALASKGKLRLEVIDPEPFSEAEERAVSAGIQGVPISRSENIYFGLEGVDSTDAQKTIPFFNQQKEEFLEYDVSTLIHNLANPKKKKLALLSALPLEGKQGDQMARAMGQESGTDPWIVYQQLSEQYEITPMTADADNVPDGTDVLLVVHPKNLPAKTTYAIDQFVLGGGRTLVFVDPLSESDDSGAQAGNALARFSAPRNSEMPDLFKAWGIEMVPGKVAADLDRAQTVSVGNRNRPEQAKYVAYLALQDDNVDKKSPVTSQLETINLATSGILQKTGTGTTEVEPLLETSTNSMQVDLSKVQMFPDPKELIKEFLPSNKKQAVAVRVSGEISTAYPNGVEGVKAPNHLEKSKVPLNAIIVADTDLLTDRLWVQVQRFMGQQMVMPLANNSDFVINAVDYLGGSNDLISIRGRGKFNRPFTAVQELEKKAQERFAEEEKQLQLKLTEAEARLGELQQKRPDGAKATILTDAQRSEIEKFTKDKVETQKKLRRVQLELRRDVESLGMKLKFLNIGLIPILVGFFAVGLGIVRANRRRRR